MNRAAPSLTSDKIAFYPEYTGVLVQDTSVAMSSAMIVDSQSAARVASAFLNANGLK